MKGAALPIFGDAYLADTHHLTLEEHGAYFKLLLLAWRSPGCSLPDDDQRLARMLAIGPAKWAKLKPCVMAFWILTDGAWTQKRLSKERAWTDNKRRVQSENASAKWEGSSSGSTSRDQARVRSERLSAARQIARHTKEEWAQLLALTGHKCVKCHISGVDLVKDHITPIYRGGSDGLDNLQPLCVPCNSSKGSECVDYRLSACKDLFERLPNAYRTSPPPPPLSIPNGMGVPPVDTVKAIWDIGITLLTASGHDERSARSIVGRWRKGRKDGDVLAAIIECKAKDISNPVEWMPRRLAAIRDTDDELFSQARRYRGTA